MKAPKSKTEKAELADRKKAKGAEPENATSAKDAKKVNVNLTKKRIHPDGLDKWNDRLDRNLESEREGNAEADENARDYSEKYGSGDQSDED
ncbi:hypothetical protein [Pedobacter nyackensis]|uniref:hypothetical protein n=1 Tax=Pedobacter nyackensis TaxID=475255 RepID=UPI00292F3DE4|nr:hypothetical protein [Pedobacter nyackensis]